MNALVGEKLDHHSKAQTTRHSIISIVSGEDFVIVYLPRRAFWKPRTSVAGVDDEACEFGAVTDADVILCDGHRRVEATVR